MNHLQSSSASQRSQLDRCLDLVQLLSFLFPLEREFLSADCLSQRPLEHSGSSR